MEFWQDVCDSTIPNSPRIGSTLRKVISNADLVELRRGLPEPVAALLAERHALTFRVLLPQLRAADITDESRLAHFVNNHRASHLLHRDRLTRFVAPQVGRIGTFVLHPDRYPEAHSAGLRALKTFPVLEPAIARAANGYLQDESELAEYSIYLSLEVSLVLGQLPDAERRRILAAHQTAVIRTSGDYGYTQEYPERYFVKTVLLLGGKVPHLKRLDTQTDLGDVDRVTGVLDVAS